VLQMRKLWLDERMLLKAVFLRIDPTLLVPDQNVSSRHAVKH
jgi:hypothetical protein